MYFSRFFTAAELPGGEVLPPAPKCHALTLTGDAGQDAQVLRQHLLVKRAALNGILFAQAEKRFYVRAGSPGWQKYEPSRIVAKAPILFEQLVYRAIYKENISIQRSAGLLQMPFSPVARQCDL